MCSSGRRRFSTRSAGTDGIASFKLHESSASELGREAIPLTTVVQGGTGEGNPLSKPSDAQHDLTSCVRLYETQASTAVCLGSGRHPSLLDRALQHNRALVSGAHSHTNVTRTNAHLLRCEVCLIQAILLDHLHATWNGNGARATSSVVGSGWSW